MVPEQVELLLVHQFRSQDAHVVPVNNRIPLFLEDGVDLPNIPFELFAREIRLLL